MTRALIFTTHAVSVMTERLIEREWVERVVNAPQWREPDPADIEVTRCFGALPERNGRYLRVACVESETEIRILSAFLDRRARPK